MRRHQTLIPNFSCNFVSQGITGHELCHYFWDPKVRMEWEGTLDSTNTIEAVSDDTVITHQIHKRVWPTTQRDALFWSHIRHVTSNDETRPDMWIVCNYSTEHDSTPVSMKIGCLLFFYFLFGNGYSWFCNFP